MRSAGFGLLELLIALMISALVLLALTQAMMTQQRAAVAVENWARLLENGRFAQSAIFDALRQADERLPCARQRQDHKSQRITAPSALFNPHLRIIGWEAQGTGVGARWWLSSPSQTANHSGPTPVPPPLAARLDRQSDAVVIQSVNTQASVQVSEVTPWAFHTQRHHRIKSCRWVVVSDCAHDFEFQLTGAEPRTLRWHETDCTPGNHLGQPTPLHWLTADPSHLFVVTRDWQAWFVGPNEDGGRTLYRMLMHQGLTRVRTEAIVDDIETLQLEYAYRAPASPRVWLSAEQVPDWRSVEAVRFAVVARLDSQQSPRGTEVRAPLLSGELQWPSDQPHVVFGSAVSFQ